MKHCGKETILHQYDLFKYSFCEVCRKEVTETDDSTLPTSNFGKFLGLISSSLKETILYKFGATSPLSCEIRESTDSPVDFFILRNDPLLALSSKITFHLLKDGNEVSWKSISEHQRNELEKLSVDAVALWCDDFHFYLNSKISLRADISVEKVWLNNGLSLFKKPPVVINPSP